MKREVHPAFFWLWAICLATALIRLDELTFSVASIVATIIIVRVASINSGGRATLSFALRLAAFAVAVRMLFAILIGVPMPGRVLFSLPQIALPDFLVGVRVGGEVTSQRLLSALSEASLFAGLIIAFAGANALSTPTKILKIVPRKLYGVGVATALAATLTPQFANSITRIKRAQFLRGQVANGYKSWRRIGTPVFEDALTRSLDLAAALEARGYGLYENPTRYRPIKWDLTHLVALLPVIYLALLYPVLTLTPLLGLILFVTLILAPVLVLR